MRVKAKICGIKTAEALAAAIAGGAAFVGLNVHPRSPRALTLEAAASLRTQVPPSITAVVLVVDPDDETIERIRLTVRPDMLQLHGSENVQRVAQIRERANLPVIKAIGVTTSEDLVGARDYEPAADLLMFDAKPALGTSLPGGGGRAFDWRILAGQHFARPWFLAGGLNADNVTEAVEISGARLVDVSSGVEIRRGEKDPALIRGFLDRVRTL